MADNRTPRDSETRYVEQRIENWAPASILPEPAKEPGFAYRWIRTAVMGQGDPTNVSSKLREGWVPVKASDHPELQLFQNPDPNSPFKDNVEVGGLILCKTPERLVQQRDAHYNRSAQAQMESVDNNFMRQSDARMPLFSEKRTEVKFGKGSK